MCPRKEEKKGREYKERIKERKGEGIESRSEKEREGEGRSQQGREG